MTLSTEITLASDGTLTGPNAETRLTKQELTLLIAVAGRKGGVLTTQAALTELYRGLDEPYAKIISVYICKVRSKLCDVGVTEALETVWGQGYRWNCNVKLVTKDVDFISMEAPKELTERLEDLALATNCNVSTLLQRIVKENIEKYEQKAWA